MNESQAYVVIIVITKVHLLQHMVEATSASCPYKQG